MTSITIRPLDAADHDDWYVLWRGYQAFYKVDLAPDISRTTWQATARRQ